jgi:hypothetical protein
MDRNASSFDERSSTQGSSTTILGGHKFLQTGIDVLPEIGKLDSQKMIVDGVVLPLLQEWPWATAFRMV